MLWRKWHLILLASGMIKLIVGKYQQILVVSANIQEIPHLMPSLQPLRVRAQSVE